MLSIPLKYEVSSERIVKFKLPDSIRPGRYDLVVIINPEVEEPPLNKTQAERLMSFAGTVRFEGEDPVRYPRNLRNEWQ